MIVCESCANAYHAACHKPKVKDLPKGPWYCKPCENEIE